MMAIIYYGCWMMQCYYEFMGFEVSSFVEAMLEICEDSLVIWVFANMMTKTFQVTCQ